MARLATLRKSEPTNGAAETISLSEPYSITVEIEGSADFLFHRWNPESIDEKAKAAKNSAAKKTDDIESYVYRNDAGELCVPGEYLRQAVIHAAKFRQDPRSPRKSAMDLFKAGVVSLTTLAPILAGQGVSRLDEVRRGEARPAKVWDYEDKRRVVIQRNGVNRTRPAMRAGWKCEFQLMVMLPEYITRDDLNQVIGNAGRLIGLGDFRPTYGRFHITRFEAA